MEQEKIEEIKKALECCKQNEIENTCEYCGNCPASNWDYETECNVELFQKALILINHQDFQISTLKVQVANLEKELKKEQINHLYYRQDSQFKESRIAELEKENEIKTDTIVDLLKKQEFYETEKLKQFAEKVLKFVKEYAFKDSKEIYTNGAILVPLFRVEYALETGGQDYQQG